MELSVIVPTYNENDNVELLVSKLSDALNGIDWEVIFVDDGSLGVTQRHIKRRETGGPFRCDSAGRGQIATDMMSRCSVEPNNGIELARLIARSHSRQKERGSV